MCLVFLVLGKDWLGSTISWFLIIKLPDKANSSSMWTGKISKGAFKSESRFFQHISVDVFLGEDFDFSGNAHK